MVIERQSSTTFLDPADRTAREILERVRTGRLSPEQAARIAGLIIAAGYVPEDPSGILHLRSLGSLQQVRVGEVTLEPNTGELRIGERVVILPGMPTAVLTTLMESPGRAFTRPEIIERVGVKAEYDSNAIDVYVGQIRRAMHDTAPPHEYVATRRGYGYFFRKPSGLSIVRAV